MRRRASSGKIDNRVFNVPCLSKEMEMRICVMGEVESVAAL